MSNNKIYTQYFCLVMVLSCSHCHNRNQQCTRTRTQGEYLNNSFSESSQSTMPVPHQVYKRNLTTFITFSKIQRKLRPLETKFPPRDHLANCSHWNLENTLIALTHDTLFVFAYLATNTLIGYNAGHVAQTWELR